MAALNIRNIGNTLVQRLKSEAALSGKTLREYVIEKLESRDSGIPDVQPSIEVPAAQRRESAPARRVHRAVVEPASGPRCKHGTALGGYCGFCFGTVMKHMTKGE